MTEFGKQLGSLKRTLTRAARTAAQLPDIPDAQIEVLRILEEQEFSTTSELAARMQLARSTMSNLLGAMQRADLVDLLRTSDDRRLVTVTASSKALTLLAAYDTQVDHVLRAAMQHLTAAERETLRNAGPIMARLVKLLQAP